ncbi:MAG: hypothetical protein A2341_05930 [Deltaproteobacteria bacterium RIFOXYB12_FULL_58_9]|nr:MAG: hypothetical protein A2341_05930 [Deltaproteobacteria bacterium RIFOXYB12_FULL_58_9]
MAKFTFEEAEALLPKIKQITAKASARIEELVGRAYDFPEEDLEREEIEQIIRVVINDWGEAIRSYGALPKGLWLVDFDSGGGFYYCWQHPEERIAFIHSQNAGFAEREPIVPGVLH